MRKEYVATYLSRQIAERITAGQIGAFEGAKEIWQIYNMWNRGLHVIWTTEKNPFNDI